ncbi:EamA family transporter [Silvibacterium sp.]|uniref:EamA family transporter n=1 Tax=Silvibacterium sp. TaxID=1964179 RepID=UPI0039E3EA33
MIQNAGADALMIGSVVVTATVGDIMIASAMRSIGDLDEIRAKRGIFGAIGAVLSSVKFITGVTFMALSFFSLLFALSNADLSLVAPATASLTFVTNAVAAKFFLKEAVDRRRWIAAILVCAGVALITH